MRTVLEIVDAIVIGAIVLAVAIPLYHGSDAAIGIVALIGLVAFALSRRLREHA